MNWGSVRRKVAARPWAAGVLAAVEADYHRWRRELVIPGPGAPTAWTHHYFCDADGAPLRFDVTSPGRHRCTGCERVYEGEPWDGAWRTRMHNAAAAQAQRAALLTRLAPVEAGAELERIFAGYDYLAYEPHGVNAGTGRVQPQSLDEAVWAVGMLRALRWAGDVLSPGTSESVARMAAGIVDLLRPQVGAVHNIHCWLLAAIAECAALLDDRPLSAWCREEVETQIRAGFHPEGLWYEINPHYHYYALAALLSYAEVGTLSDEAASRLVRAVTAPPLLAYADGRLPAYGDGWADCFVGDFASQAEAAWGVLGPVDLAPYYAHPRPGPVRLWFGNPDHADGSAELSGRSSVAALVFGPDEVAAKPREPGSFVWPVAGIGVLRSAGVRVGMRFGPDAGGHDHRDKLNVDVRTRSGWASLDLGTSGYGSEFTRWMRSPRAHNLIVVNGEPQPPHTGRLLEFTDRRLSAESRWQGRRFRRTVRVEDDGWSDRYAVWLDRPEDLEWIFHGDGVFLPDEGVWDVPGSPRLTLRIPAGFEVVTEVAGGNPSGHPLGLVVVRGRAQEAVFEARFLMR